LEGIGLSEGIVIEQQDPLNVLGLQPGQSLIVGMRKAKVCATYSKTWMGR
jgi:hypothetical protein